MNLGLFESHFDEIQQRYEESKRQFDLANQEITRLKKYEEMGMKILEKADISDAQQMLQKKLVSLEGQVKGYLELTARYENLIVESWSLKRAFLNMDPNEKEDLEKRVNKVKSKRDDLLKTEGNYKTNLLRYKSNKEVLELMHSHMLESMGIPRGEIDELIERERQNHFFDPIIQIVVCKSYDEMIGNLEQEE